VVFLAASWIILSLICLPFGLALIYLAGADCFQNIGDRVVASLWLGVMTLGLLMLFASIFTALTPIAGAVIGGAALLSSLASTKVRDELHRIVSSVSAIKIVACAFILLLSAAFMIRPVSWYDSGLYHIQAIKWLSNFGTPPGIALIHGRLGFTSLWFALAAPFSAGRMDGRSGTVMAGVALCWALLHALILGKRILRREATHIDWFIFSAYLLYLPYEIGFDITISPAPDMPIALAIIVIAWLILVVSKSKELGAESAYANACLLPVMFSCGAMAIKVSAMFTLPITMIFYLSARWNGIYHWLRGLMVSALMTLPLFATNIMASGCPLYPSSLMCLDAPWSVGAAGASLEAALVKSYARWGYYTFNEDNFGWILPWIKNRTEITLYVVALVLITVALLKKDPVKEIPGYQQVLAIAGLGTAMILYAGPQMRFGLGYFALAPALAASANRKIVLPLLILIPFGSITDWSMRPVRFILSVFLAVLFALLLFIKRESYVKGITAIFLIVGVVTPVKALAGAAYQNLLLSGNKMEYVLLPPIVARTRMGILIEKRANDLKYIYCPSPTQDCACWDAELPCTPSLFYEDVKLREPKRGLAGGIVRDK
jgi:hypothetical protein